IRAAFGLFGSKPQAPAISPGPAAESPATLIAPDSVTYAGRAWYRRRQSDHTPPVPSTRAQQHNGHLVISSVFRPSEGHDPNGSWKHAVMNGKVCVITGATSGIGKAA